METILIIRLSAMGDVAIAAPVLQQLVKTYPKKKILLLTRKAFFPIFEFTNPAVELIAVDDFLKNGVFGIYQLFIKLQQFKVDKIADFHNVLRTQILRTFYYFTKTKWVSLDKNRKAKKEITKRNKTTIYQLKQVHEAYADVLNELGCPILLSNNLVESPAIKINAIGLAPGSKHITKNWQAENNELLIDYVLKNSTADVYLFGDPRTESELIENLKALSPRVKSTFELSLIEQLTLIQSLRVVVSMDSANMHLASAVGTPVVSVWCATSPIIGFLGYGQKEKDAVLKGLDCQPCSVYGNKPCWRGDLACTNIPIELAINKVAPYLT